MKTYQHSGKIGDCLIGVPYIQAMGGGLVYLRECAEFTADAIESLLPLLNAQPGVKAEEWAGQAVDVNLDLFRAVAIGWSSGNLAKTYQHAFSLRPDLTRPWLHVPQWQTFNVSEQPGYYKTVVVNRTLRYRNRLLSYRFLHSKKYENVVFIGNKIEFQLFKQEVKKARHVPTRDMLEAAWHIAGAKVYIGNSSACWWCAEGLAVPRVLEVCPETPNTFPATPNGFDCLYQPDFEQCVQNLYD